MKDKLKLPGFSLLIFYFVFGATYAFAQKRDRTLANKVYNVQVTEKNLDGTEYRCKDDKIRFAAGKVKSDFSTRNGFADAPYIVTIDSTTNPILITFTGESRNDKKNTLKWFGTIKGNTIEGRATRTRSHAVGGDYVFSGTLKQ